MIEPATPASSGFRMPAEWEPHTSTWLTWPHNPETWPGQNMQDVEAVYLDIIEALVAGELVNLLVSDAPTKDQVLKQLEQKNISADRVHLKIIPTNDSWIRDYGPNFLVAKSPSGKQIALNKWRFDSWGEKYDWALDNQAGYEISRKLGFPLFEPGIVLEGGAIDVNGQGVCLTTRTCLLNPNRNGELSQEIMEKYLRDYLGVQKIIWLTGEIEGDDTDGHVDNLARFVNPSTICCATEENPAAKHYTSLKENYERLQSATDPNGNPFKVVPIPMPGRVGSRTERLPASYLNFYIANKCVLLPVYGQPEDIQAKTILQNVFPERTIVEIPCQTLIWGLGSIHCITQQQPG
jgi:agmatine deiminase